MTASELVEQLQKIIKEDGDFDIEYLDFGEYGSSWSFPIENVKIRFNAFNKKIIGVY